jgi:hypothetical protein
MGPSCASQRLIYARKTRTSNVSPTSAQIVRMIAARTVNKQMPAAKAANKE